MANIINASTSSGLVQTADTSGTIELQSSGSTKLTVNSSGATVPTATVTTLNTPTGVLATQNGMTGIAKAWVNFGYVSSATVVRGSFNVSSVTRNALATYTVNYTTAMPNANYAAIVGVLGDSSPYNQPIILELASYTASSMKVYNSPDYSLSATDPALMTVVVFSS